MLNKLKAFIGRLTYPEDAFYDGYNHTQLSEKTRFCHDGFDFSTGRYYDYRWDTLKQNWLGVWVIDHNHDHWTTEDLRKYAEEQSK